MKIFDIVKDFGSLSLSRTTRSSHIVIVLRHVFDLMPLPSYYIDRPRIGDLNKIQSIIYPNCIQSSYNNASMGCGLHPC
jgi:hypothetical protein